MQQEIIKDFDIREKYLSYIYVDDTIFIRIFDKQTIIMDDYEIDVSKISPEFREIFNSVPIGATYPMMLLKKNGEEIIFAYKEEDGTNSVTIATLIDNEWVRETQTKPGNKLEFNDFN